MKAEEVREALKPIYDELEKNMIEGHLEANFKHLHTDCVVVQKGKDVSYGREQIGAKMKKFFEENKPKNIKRSNATYNGCECCICVAVEVSFDTPKGPAKVIEHHIWKKQNNEWKLYHIEYEMA
ncbi:SnoaL domain-containing protein [Trichostrongylus colubriformis]|uniref:SnoaL domain-containing protein n=1 Tax=Trichostrongylus colubriformis TaxID=6319 RepID=A0AAN8IH03_TRICO